MLFILFDELFIGLLNDIYACNKFRLMSNKYEQNKQPSKTNKTNQSKELCV